jgi:hypothetical protein
LSLIPRASQRQVDQGGDKNFAHLIR